MKLKFAERLKEYSYEESYELEKIKKIQGINHDEFNSTIQMWIQAAATDLKSIGIVDTLVDNPDDLIQTAIITYVLSFISKIVNNVYGLYFLLFVPIVVLVFIEIIKIIEEKKEERMEKQNNKKKDDEEEEL